jgi:hypothetical protein
MAFRFRVRGKGVKHSWQKECGRAAALAHAKQVAREYGNDGLYQRADIRVLDRDGNEIAIVPVARPLRPRD